MNTSSRWGLTIPPGTLGLARPSSRFDEAPDSVNPAAEPPENPFRPARQTKRVITGDTTFIQPPHHNSKILEVRREMKSFGPKSKRSFEAGVGESAYRARTARRGGGIRRSLWTSQTASLLLVPTHDGRYSGS